MFIEDSRSSLERFIEKIITGIGLLIKVLLFVGKNFFLGWTIGAILFTKPKNYDIVTKVTIFMVGKNVILGKYKKQKTKRYLK